MIPTNKFFLVFLIIIALLTACDEQITQDINYETPTEDLTADEETTEPINTYDMPLVESYSFGSIVINGRSHTNVKLYKGKVSNWNIIKRHVFMKADIEDIVDDIDYLVMGLGYSSQVKVEQETLDFLEQKGITTIIKDTKSAVNEYNKFVKENKKVAAILHGTC